MCIEKGMRKVAKMMPKWSQDGKQNCPKSRKSRKNGLRKSMEKKSFSARPGKLGKNGPRSDFGLNRAEKVMLGGDLQRQGSLKAPPPDTRMRYARAPGASRKKERSKERKSGCKGKRRKEKGKRAKGKRGKRRKGKGEWKKDARRI